MDWFVRAFVKAALTWLGIGVTLGIAMAVHPPWTIHRAAHMHINLLGFISMMIFGVAYHVIPRFAGHPLRSPRLAAAHWWIANLGLALLAGGLIARPYLGAGQLILIAGGLLSAFGAYAFIANLWMTIDGKQAPAAQVVPLRRG